jgi:hypothetical protein
MADWGTLTTRSLSASVTRANPLTFGGSTHTEFNLGTLAVRSIGSSGEPVVIEVPVIVPAPPSTHGLGDWPMRFFPPALENGQLEVDTEGEPNELYMCPENSVLYVRYYEIFNFSGSSRTVKLYFGDPENPYKRINAQTLADGASFTSPAGFMFNLGEGELIMGSASGSGVYCHIEGVEAVQA